MSVPHLFVWRGRHTVRETVTTDLPATFQCKENAEFREKWAALYHEFERRCPFCRGNYEYGYRRNEGRWVYTNYSEFETCRRCGFCKEREVGQGMQDSWVNEYVATLLELDINSSELGLRELCTHLKRRYEDIYNLSPQRFEEVVADVFRYNFGYMTQRTQSSRDGGYDIVLLEGTTGKKIIVECKRYSKGRKVGVGVVRQLLGVQLVNNFSEAKLVSSSHFTQPAKDATQSEYMDILGFKLGLIDADALLRELQAYNEKLPPLYAIDLKNHGYSSDLDDA